MADPQLTEAQWAALDRLYGGDAEVWTLGDPPQVAPPSMPEAALVLPWADATALSDLRLIAQISGYAGKIWWESRRLVGSAQGRDWWRRQQRAAT